MRSAPNCECPTGWTDSKNGVDCAEVPHPDGLSDLIPSTPKMDKPAARIDDL